MYLETRRNKACCKHFAMKEGLDILTPLALVFLMRYVLEALHGATVFQPSCQEGG